MRNFVCSTYSGTADYKTAKKCDLSTFLLALNLKSCTIFWILSIAFYKYFFFCFILLFWTLENILTRVYRSQLILTSNVNCENAIPNLDEPVDFIKNLRQKKLFCTKFGALIVLIFWKIAANRAFQTLQWNPDQTTLKLKGLRISRLKSCSGHHNRICDLQCMSTKT